MWHGYDSMPWMWRAPRDLKAHAEWREGTPSITVMCTYYKKPASICVHTATTPYTTYRTLNCSAALLLVAGCSGR
jgi:hypothetical protein